MILMTTPAVLEYNIPTHHTLHSFLKKTKNGTCIFVTHCNILLLTSLPS